MSHRTTCIVLLPILFALCGSSTASSKYPKITLKDLSVCKSSIAAVHKHHIRVLQHKTTGYCKQKNPNEFERMACQSGKEEIIEAKRENILMWYYAGNDICDGETLPCFGIHDPYDYQENDEDVLEKVREVARGTSEYAPYDKENFDALPAEKCVAKMWLKKNANKVSKRP